MSYKTGRMGMAEGIALVFVLTIPRLFLTAPAEVVDAAGPIGWLIPLFSSITPLIAFWLLVYVLMQTAGDDLFTAAQHFLGPIVGFGIGLFYAVMFLLNAAILLRQFAENTLLTALPLLEFSTAVGLYVLVAAIVIYASIEGLSRAAYIILPFGTVAIIISLLLLFPFYNFYHLFPWQGKGLGTLFKSSILLSGANIGVIALAILAPSFQNLRTIKIAGLFGLGGVALLRTASTLAFVMIFGCGAGREKTLAFFEMVRLVNLSRYLQRVEALFILLWVIVGVLAIAANLYVGMYLITRLFNLPALRPIIPIVCLLIAQIAMIPDDITDVIQLAREFNIIYMNVGLYAIPFLLFIAAFIRRRKRRAGACTAES
ncbi:MAG: GerAB/ArcD/ProY family transporter [Veillonellales bacterium]